MPPFRKSGAALTRHPHALTLPAVRVCPSRKVGFGGWVRAVAAASLLFAAPAAAQESFRIDQAVRFALEHHPALRGRAASEKVATARADVARAGELPDLSAVGQVNRATGNVVPGSLFGMRNLPAISGPPRGRTFDEGAWGTTVGATASWDLIGLARRMREVDAALAEVGRAKDGTDVVRLDVAFDSADRFIEAVVREQAVLAAHASLERAAVFVGMVKALVDQSLRPGVDLSRAESERALAETQLARAEQAAAIARVQLAEALGAPERDARPVAEPLLSTPTIGPRPASAGNPRLREAESARRSAAIRRAAVGLEYLPRLEFLGALWTRGSGLSAGGVSYGKADGLVPNTPNWAVGLVLTWPVLETVAARARTRAEEGNVELASARQQEIAQAIQAQLSTAAASLEGARKVATKTPVAVTAAQAAERQATARYKAGLAPAVDVADAQRLLAQAEIEDAVARAQIWRGLLYVARATGDLSPFLDQVQSALGKE
jgi:outer membrane protein TolC